ncbi:peptidylprolyl isomerase [Bacteroidia bacterium]|nr:peptidylprolyl isomerase [Bacteroidia bacterium]
MATLEKIRSKAGLLVSIVGLALFAFIIGDFLNSGSTYFRQHQETIANINGKVVNYQEFQKRVDEMSDVYKMQYGSNSLPEEAMTQIRQSVFDTYTQEYLLNDEMEKIGMTVSPEELFDMVQGENISPILLQNQMFHNPNTGTFDKTFFLNFLKAINDDNIASAPADQQAQLLQYKSLWLFWEKAIKMQRMEQKYSSLLSKAISANKLDAKEEYDATSGNADIVYAMQSYSSIPDSTIAVSKSEIEKLYNERKELYQQPETKVIKYISVPIVPSQADYDAVSSEIDKLKDEFTTSSDVTDLVDDNSETPYVDAFYSEAFLDPEVKQFVASATTGEVYGPIFENSSTRYRMFKLLDKTSSPDSVKVSHIMLPNNARGNEVADSLFQVLKNGGDFAELATNYSLDQSSSSNEGEIGWFTESEAIRALNGEFKTTIFTTPINQVTLLKSTQATQIIKVTERTSNVPKYKLAYIDITVSPSSKTYSNLYNALSQYISKNQDIDKIEANAQEAGYNLLSDVSVTKTDQTLGSISQSRQVIRWAFEHKKGEISEIFDCDNKNFVVAAVQGTIQKGYRPLNLLEPSLKAELISQKKGEQIASELKSKNLSTLDAYAQAMNANIDSVKFINFNTYRITGIGIEPKLNAYISLSSVNQLSSPVIGNNGVYVFQVVNKTASTQLYDEATQVNLINSANTYRISYQAMQSLINHADIKDNRIRFY